jgi:hypothetical protein
LESEGKIRTLHVDPYHRSVKDYIHSWSGPDPSFRHENLCVMNIFLNCAWSSF